MNILSGDYIHDAVVKYSQSLMRIAFTYTKNIADAEDITQEAFLALLNTRKSFDSDEHLKAWLIRVTINKAKNYVKSGWFKRRNEFTEDLSYLPAEEKY